MSHPDAKHCIYILSNPAFRDGIVKVGLTTRHVDERIKELRTTELPTRYKVAGFFAFDAAISLRHVEAIAHRGLKADGYHLGGELFSFPDGVDPVECVNKLIGGVVGRVCALNHAEFDRREALKDTRAREAADDALYEEMLQRTVDLRVAVAKQRWQDEGTHRLCEFNKNTILLGDTFMF